MNIKTIEAHTHPRTHRNGDAREDTTGRIRYRTNCLNKQIIQVEVHCFVFGDGWMTKWIDADQYHICIAE